MDSCISCAKTFAWIISWHLAMSLLSTAFPKNPTTNQMQRKTDRKKNAEPTPIMRIVRKPKMQITYSLPYTICFVLQVKSTSSACLTQWIPKTIPYHLHLHRVNKRFCLVVRIVAVVVWLRYNLVCRLSFLLYNCILCSRVEIRESNAHRTIWIHDRRESIHSKHNNHINFSSAFL